MGVSLGSEPVWGSPVHSHCLDGEARVGGGRGTHKLRGAPSLQTPRTKGTGQIRAPGNIFHPESVSASPRPNPKCPNAESTSL